MIKYISYLSSPPPLYLNINLLVLAVTQEVKKTPSKYELPDQVDFWFLSQLLNTGQSIYETFPAISNESHENSYYYLLLITYYYLHKVIM